VTPNELALSLELPKRAVALVLAGGRGSRLMSLTDLRAKPAVHFGGKFRIIDFALSNCLNSGVRRIGVLTQYKSHSLIRHIQRGWAFLKSEMNEFVDLMPAQQRIDEASWYRGTADAVYQNHDILRSYGADYIVVLAGDHIYKMNYAVMLADHVAKGRPCTVACIEVPRLEARGFGVMAVDENRRITDFIEKPADPPPMPGKPESALASMGIYIFNADYLYRELERDIRDPASSHDFGKDIIPHAVRQGDATAHPFELSAVGSEPGDKPYWRDVGTVDAYWDANIDLTATSPLLDMYDARWPIWTYQPQLPPAKFVHNQDDRRGTAIESLVSGGCIVSGHVERSVLYSNVRAHSYSRVNWSVLLPDVSVGRGARISRAARTRTSTRSASTAPPPG
jgi:glucose-1-phosphate adenylyltransferase